MDERSEAHSGGVTEDELVDEADSPGYLGTSVSLPLEDSGSLKRVIFYLMRSPLPPRVSGAVWSHFGLSHLRGGVQVETRDAAPHPPMHRTAPLSKNDSVPDVPSVMVEIHGCRLMDELAWSTP